MGSYTPVYNIEKNSKKTIKKILTSVNKTKKHFSDIKHIVDTNKNKILDVKKDNKKIKKILINNITKFNKINPKNIIPPRQCHSNCWFNVLFMMHFISDKGRKFFEPMRLLMIKGNYDKSLIKTTNIQKFKKALFLFNIAIDSVLTGSTFSKYMNTNELLTYIYDSIKVKRSWVKKKGEFGNSLDYFLALMKLIYKKEFINFIILNKIIDVNKLLYIPQVLKMSYLPELIIIEIYDEASTKITNKKSTIFVKFNNNTHEYILDSICLRDINKQHVGCFITLNKEDYFFDGDSKHRIKNQPWNSENLLNKSKIITFDKYTANFNLMSGYQILYYFRNN
jgi:hypothetical protein